MRPADTAVLPGGSTASSSPALNQITGTGIGTGTLTLAHGQAQALAQTQTQTQTQTHADYQPQPQPQPQSQPQPQPQLSQQHLQQQLEPQVQVQAQAQTQVQAQVQAQIQAQAQAQTQAPRRRAGVACRRCRRQRTKCLHQHGRAPCDSCVAAGPSVAATCSFPTRGEKDTDRLFRRRTNGQLVGQDGLVSRPSSSPPDPSSTSRTSTVSPLPMPLPLPPSLPPPSPPNSSSCTSSLAPLTPIGAALAERNITTVNTVTIPAASTTTSSTFTTSNISNISNISNTSNASNASTSITSSVSPPTFPPHDEIIEGCKVFMSSYFQLGFLPKAVFIERLHRHPDTASRFLLAGMLAIASRFTPVLVRRYGSPAATTEFFLGAARDMAAAHDNMYRPSLERTQAFFLLAIAEWGNGDRDRSSVHMGVAVRMAALLKLHREEAYVLPATASSDQIVRAESARRTFWMIMSQENLHAGHMTPAPFAREDISACLPCDEADFAFGILPSAATHNERAALAGTIPALRRPELAALPNRCLFATLIQAHDLWGRVARCTTSEACPWLPGSSFRALTEALRVWEDGIPARHRWSVWNLRGWCAESLHLAYLSVVMVVRLGNIVIRRIYLERIIKALDADADADTDDADDVDKDEGGGSGDNDSSSKNNDNDINDKAASSFWQTVSYDLFANVLELHEQVDAYARMRMRDEGFPAILVFCSYMCGSLTAYLGRHPRLCPHISPAEAQDMSRGAIQVLSELQPAWPTSAKWHQGLQQASHAAASTASASSTAISTTTATATASSTFASATPAATITQHHPTAVAPEAPPDFSSNDTACITTMHDEVTAVAPPPLDALDKQAFTATAPDQAPTPLQPRPWDGNTPRERNGGFEIVPGSFPLADNVNSSYAIFPPFDPFVADQFSAEVTAFLGGDFQYGLLDL